MAEKKRKQPTDEFFEKGEKFRFKPGAEQQEIARRASAAGQESKRRTRTMRDAVKILMSLDTSDERKKAALEAMGLEPSNRNAATFAMIQKAINGSERAYEILRDTAGEQPKLSVGLSLGDEVTEDAIKAMSDAELEALIKERGGEQ